MCKWEPLDCGVSNFRQPHVTVKTYVFPNMNGWMSIHKLQLFLDVNKRVSVVRSIAVMVWHASGFLFTSSGFGSSGLWLFWGTSRRRGQAAGSFRPLFLSLSVQLSLGCGDSEWSNGKMVDASYVAPQSLQFKKADTLALISDWHVSKDLMIMFLHGKKSK